jgi:penicillin amidase
VLAGSEEMGLSIVHSAVCRYVFDLGDWDNSRWIVPLGSSGHPASPHYTDQVSDWAACRLRPMTYSWPLVEAEAETRQVLEPDR